MLEEYVVSHVNPMKYERFLIRERNHRGTQYATSAEARGELADMLCKFSSVEDIVKLLKGDPSVQPARCIPPIFRLDNPNSDGNVPIMFIVYRLNKGIPEITPRIILNVKGNKLITYAGLATTREV